jgi:hypothetical protein
VCRQWRVSIERFAADVVRQPTADHVFERVNLAGNFMPRNCHWNRRSESGMHGHKRRLIEYNDQRLGVKEWAQPPEYTP